MVRLLPLVLCSCFAAPARAQTAQDFERLLARASSCTRPATCSAPSRPTRPRSPSRRIAPTRCRISAPPTSASASTTTGSSSTRRRSKRTPVNTTFRLNLALAYYKSARPNEAHAPAQTVVASEPEAKNAYLVLADCYLQTGQDQEVIALLKPREQMFGDDLAYAYLLGTALLHTGDEARGRNTSTACSAPASRPKRACCWASRTSASRTIASAKTELERAAAQSEAADGALALRPRAAAARRAAAAERAFRRELDVNVNDFEANLQLGNMRKSAQRFAEAVTYLERATTIRPDDLAARKLLASLRLQTGKVEEAVAMLEAIVKDAPDASKSTSSSPPPTTV